MKYLYWGATGLVALLAIGSGSSYFFAEAPAETFDHLGFPDYFRIQLGIAKVLGGIALLAPLPRVVKEWVYAGFTINFISAAIAHIAAGDPIAETIPPVVAFILLVVSYVTYHTYYRSDRSQR